MIFPLSYMSSDNFVAHRFMQQEHLHPRTYTSPLALPCPINIRPFNSPVKSVNMINVNTYIPRFTELFPELHSSIWQLPGLAEKIIAEKIKGLSPDYIRTGSAYIHRGATVEQHVIMKGPMIISDEVLAKAAMPGYRRKPL